MSSKFTSLLLLLLLISRTAVRIQPLCVRNCGIPFWWTVVWKERTGDQFSDMEVPWWKGKRISILPALVLEHYPSWWHDSWREQFDDHFFVYMMRNDTAVVTDPSMRTSSLIESSHLWKMRESEPFLSLPLISSHLLEGEKWDWMKIRNATDCCVCVTSSRREMRWDGRCSASHTWNALSFSLWFQFCIQSAAFSPPNQLMQRRKAAACLPFIILSFLCASYYCREFTLFLLAGSSFTLFPTLTPSHTPQEGGKRWKSSLFAGVSSYWNPWYPSVLSLYVYPGCGMTQTHIGETTTSVCFSFQRGKERSRHPDDQPFISFSSPFVLCVCVWSCDFCFPAPDLFWLFSLLYNLMLWAFFLPGIWCLGDSPPLFCFPESVSHSLRSANLTTASVTRLKAQSVSHHQTAIAFGFPHWVLFCVSPFFGRLTIRWLVIQAMFYGGMRTSFWRKNSFSPYFQNLLNRFKNGSCCYGEEEWLNSHVNFSVCWYSRKKQQQQETEKYAHILLSISFDILHGIPILTSCGDCVYSFLLCLSFPPEASSECRMSIQNQNWSLSSDVP